jgi:hypothetical protein
LLSFVGAAGLLTCMVCSAFTISSTLLPSYPLNLLKALSTWVKYNKMEEKKSLIFLVDAF